MPDIHLDDTIAALATPPGEGGIGVIRLSGPDAIRIAGEIFSSKKGSLKDAVSHTVHFGQIKDTDQVLTSIFRKPNSYTGEDVIEFSLHGGMRIVKAVLDLVFQKGARPAEPGEFTKRAFLNGKMDLTQAEAVLDLIKAKSEKSLQAALAQLNGTLSERFKRIKDALMKIYAHLEAFVDFPEEDIEVYEDKEFLKKFSWIEKELKDLIQGFSRGSLLREGVSVVLAGRPNVGKSSLFNALLARDRALVSEHAGTTRDILEENLEIQGINVRLVDTAGLGKTSHPLDQLGMERTRGAIQAADLFLYLVDASEALTDEDKLVFNELKQASAGKIILTVLNKCDLPQKINKTELEKLTSAGRQVAISSKTQKGFEDLEKQMVEQVFAGSFGRESEQITRLRHKNALDQALESMLRAHKAFQEHASLELVALDVKQALDAMKELLGEIYSEDLLDVIFSEFCIGK